MSATPTAYDKEQDEWLKRQGKQIDSHEERIVKLEGGPPPPGCGDNPDPTGEHVKAGGWGGNPDALTWEATTMKNDPTKWKVIDDKGKNIAHNFNSEAETKTYIKYHKCIQETEECPDPGNCPAGQHWDASVCKCVPNPQNGGGQDGDIKLQGTPIGSGIEYSFSSGNTDRYQLVAKLPKCFVNLLQVGYFKIAKVGDNGEEISGKNRGGRHSDSVAKEASCYIQGIGYDGTVNSQYEQPHPSNHPLPSTTVTNKPYGNSIVGKWVGLQNKIVFKDGKDYLETWVDLKAGDIDTAGKPGNDWKLFWKTETTQFAGKCNSPGPDTQSYWRLDAIPGGDDQQNCERKYCKIYEIQP